MKYKLSVAAIVFVVSLLVSFWLGLVTGSKAAEAPRPNFGPPLATECPETSETPTFQIWIRDPDWIDAEWHRQGGPANYQADAFQATLDTGEKVLVLPPLRGQRDLDRMQVWGHELGHIVCGFFHGNAQMSSRD